ncbi:MULTISPECIES: DoxX family protein [Hyphomicrobiales]|jgi:putative oxidoreductase|uniref:DoxX family protein n=1 Tax=Bosea massiliensis TaxID=151419 RepID=A0ABW0P8D1_9HYPH|nr:MULTISPECIES: DoxX family protein [Hyphomicrobiales]
MLASAQRFQPYALALLRIFTSLSFISHGTQKLLAFPAAPSWGMPAAFSLPWTAGVLEIVGGALVLIGFLTRPAAFILSGLMAVAYWMAHGSKGFYPILNGGEAAMLFCFIFLYIFTAGPGAFSVDGARRG